MDKPGFGSFFRKTQKERRSRERTPRTDTSVLVVDDSRTVIFSLKRLLEQDGYYVMTASNGEEGISMAEDYQPDLILMDVVMPGINGFRATRHIRQSSTTSDIPIIMISGSEQLTEQLWLKRLGANDFLSKPINRGSLFTTIEKQLGIS